MSEVPLYTEVKEHVVECPGSLNSLRRQSKMGAALSSDESLTWWSTSSRVSRNFRFLLRGTLDTVSVDTESCPPSGAATWCFEQSHSVNTFQCPPKVGVTRT